MNRWQRSWWLVPLGVVVALVLVTNVFPFRQIIAEGRRVEDAHNRLEALEQENAILADQVEALSTPAEIERLAREKLGYIRPGEVAYVILPPEEENAKSEVPAAGEPVRRLAWYERIWSFLTGADLTE